MKQFALSRIADNTCLTNLKSVTVFLSWQLLCECRLSFFCILSLLLAIMAPKRKQPKRIPVTGSAAESATASTVDIAYEGSLNVRVTQRLRETFGNLSSEEKDVAVCPAGLTLRQTLQRDLRLSDQKSDKAPLFGLHYNEDLRKVFRKKTSTRDLIKPDPADTGTISADLMEVIM